MNGPSIIKRDHRLRTLAIVAALIIPATSGGPLFARDAAVFAESFAAMPLPSASFTTPSGAVDITAIATPVETTPAAPSIIRSLGSGVASYYGKKFAGRPTASGERFDPTEFTAAHRTLPFGSLIQVTNPANGKSVVVRVNDRGPFSRNRSIDLSRAAAEEIGLIARGHGSVEMTLVD